MFNPSKRRNKINLQLLSSRRIHNSMTHREREKCDENRDVFDGLDTSGDADGEADEPYMEANPPNYIPVSLQQAVAKPLELFLDKTETINRWSCGLDESLRTWERNWFERSRYDEVQEKSKRERMKQYAANDCLFATRPYLHVCPREFLRRDQPTTLKAAHVDNNALIVKMT